jgi:hypothetical protein
MRFTEPGLADGLERDQRRQLGFDGILDPQRKKPFCFHRFKNGIAADFLSGIAGLRGVSMARQRESSNK